MRMHFKPYARPELEAWNHYSIKAAAKKGQWNSAFKNTNQPFVLELGCGKGGFISQLALRQPNINHLGVDIKSEVLVVAKRNIEASFAKVEKEIENVVITSWNIEKIGEILAPQDAVTKIYINFCNPWYKSGDAKHRLTHPRQLIQYRDFLVPGGEIVFKTDDTPLYVDSLRYFQLSGFEVTWCTEDLHSNEPSWNIRTEHETMFSQQGIAIKACIAKMKPAKLDKHTFSRMKDV